MPFVQRDSGGNINGTATVDQEGWGNEFLHDDDPEIVAHLNPPPEAPADTVERGITSSPIIDALVQRIAKKEGITERKLISELRALARPA